MVIPNCGITHQDSEVLKQCVMSDKDPLFKIYGEYHTGVDLSARNIFSLYDGTVVSIGDSSKGHSVIIQTGMSFCISYRWLTITSSISAGETVCAGQEIGRVDKYIHVEVLTKSQSKWPVRIGRVQWYKTDPMNVIQGNTYIESEAGAQYYSEMNIIEIPEYVDENPDNIISRESLYILSNNKG